MAGELPRLTRPGEAQAAGKGGGKRRGKWRRRRGGGRPPSPLGLSRR